MSEAHKPEPARFFPKMGEGPSESSDPPFFRGKGMEEQGVHGLEGPQGRPTGSILPSLDATSQDTSNYSIQMVDTN